MVGLNVEAQESWSLEKCVNRAISSNLSVQNLKLNQDEANIGIKEARHAQLPSLNGSVGANWNFGRSIDPTTNTFNSQTFFSNNYSLNSGITLYNGGRIQNTIKQAKVERERSEVDIKQIERDIALAVANQYLAVLFAQENIKIAQNNVANTDTQIDQMKKLIERGARPEIELFNLEAQRANNEQSLVQANNNYDAALLDLKQSLLLDSSVEFRIEEVTVTVPEILEYSTMSIDDIYKLAEKNQWSIKSAELGIEVADVGKKIANSGLLPSLSVGGSINTNYSNQSRRVIGSTLEYNDINVLIQGQQTTIGFPNTIPVVEKTPYSDQVNDNVSYGVGVSLSIPIYNNYRVTAGIQRAKLNQDRMKIVLEQEKQKLKSNIQQAWANCKAAKSTYEASELSVQAQKKAYDNAQKRFDIQAINSFELTNMKMAYDNASINNLIAKYDYLFKVKVLDFYIGKPIKID